MNKRPRRTQIAVWMWGPLLPLIVGQGLAQTAPSPTSGKRPWTNTSLTPDQRAILLQQAMTLEEELRILHGPMGRPRFGQPMPDGALGSAGYIPGIPRLGIPALQETDAGVGITNPADVRPGDGATAFPATLATAASWNLSLAHDGGAVLGDEAFRKGFNVVLAGGANLVRDPRNGRNFEYLGEDPFLAGRIAGAAIRGIQSAGVASTIKHFALNNQETGRFLADVRISDAAARESDLLAFQIGIETGQPASVMCAYNLVNGNYSCGDDWLLNKVLKADWRYPGWVMSDWGGVHATEALLGGLDQESGEQLDKQVFFGSPLAKRSEAEPVYRARVDNAVRRILRSLFAVGLMDRPAMRAPIDYVAHASVVKKLEAEGIVLLKNRRDLLPLSKARRVVVVGGLAEFGVLAGGGSSYVTAVEGPGVQLPAMGVSTRGVPRLIVYHPSSPLKALQLAMPDAEIVAVDGGYPSQAADAARTADVVIIFATQWSTESVDIPDMSLPNGQDALIARVAAANPNTVVVLETGGAVKMPWINEVGAVLEAWYPGGQGGPAIADILTGKVNPSGRLPITFPVDETQLPRPVIVGPRDAALYPSTAGKTFEVPYVEGADVGYRWFARRGLRPLFPFGHGLSYTRFSFSDLKVVGGKGMTVSFMVRNDGMRTGKAVPQVYLEAMPNGAEKRLIGWGKVELAPGESRKMTLTADPRLIAHFDERSQRWRITAGSYQLSLGASANEVSARSSAQIAADTFLPGAVPKCSPMCGIAQSSGRDGVPMAAISSGRQSYRRQTIAQ